MRNKITIFCFFTKIRQDGCIPPRSVMSLYDETGRYAKTTGRKARTCGAARAAAYNLRHSAAFCAHFAYTLYKKTFLFCQKRTETLQIFCPDCAYTRTISAGQTPAERRRPLAAKQKPCRAFALHGILFIVCSPPAENRRLRGCPGSGECGPAISAEKASAYRRHRKRPCFRARIRGFRWSCARSRALLWRPLLCPER